MYSRIEILVELNRTKWTPHSDDERHGVFEVLDKILASPQFRNSKRYPDFLRYVVDHALNGDIEQIKERTVGIEVFGRAPDYDTHTDTVVRYTAGEVRKRLALYNSQSPDAPLQIALSARSYQPEFYKLLDPEQEDPTNADASDGAPLAGKDPAHRPFPRMLAAASSSPSAMIAVCLVCIFLGSALALASQWGWSKLRPASVDRFWGPVLQTDHPILIGSGDVSLPPTSLAGSPEGPYLSYETALALGRIEALLSTRRRDYENLPSSAISLAQIRESSVVLIGAYNNDWALHLLKPLRFHFASHPNEAILDSWHQDKFWIRDASKPLTESPDYGIVARFRDPSTAGMVVVIAGLKRYGTDAASQFVASSQFLDQLDQQLKSNWRDRNIEVIIRVDVMKGKAGAPMIEAVHVW